MAKKQFKSFEEARDYVRSLGLKSQKDWNSYCKSGQKPADIPALPRDFYKDGVWKGYGDWLGTGTVAYQDREYRSFEEARDFARSLKLKGQRAWRSYCKSGQKPDDIPSDPNHVYKNMGWNGYGDWLGTYNKSCKREK